MFFKRNDARSGWLVDWILEIEWKIMFTKFFYYHFNFSTEFVHRHFVKSFKTNSSSFCGFPFRWPVVVFFLLVSQKMGTVQCLL